MLRDDLEEVALLDGLVEAINALPGASAGFDAREMLSPGGRADAIVNGAIAGKAFRLIIEAKRDAYPRDVREAIWQLRNVQVHHGQAEGEIIPFFVARTISSGARDMLRSEAVGYYDGSGSLFLPADGIYVLVDRPAAKKGKKDVAIFQGQKARVLHALFSEQEAWHSVKDLASVLEVSAATVSSTLGELERREWVDVQGAGPAKERRLKNTTEMVDAWAKYMLEQKPPKLTRYYVPRAADINDLKTRVQRVCDDIGAHYAVTGEAAAQVFAPYLTSVSELRCRIEPGRKQAEALTELEARPVREGWNLVIPETRSRNDVLVGSYHALLEANAAIAMAPALQIYLDLLQGPGRSKDMAEHLRSEILKI